MSDELVCAVCGATNDASRKFCDECGTPLGVVCASCGATNRPAARFCGECGTAFGPEASGAALPATPATERRLVSVLFADLVGFTNASEGRDPEETRELLSRYFETARTIVDRYGGTVEKFIGDAVMAVWGTPVAQEDDAERAVRAALDLVRAVPGLDPLLEARAGVLTGEAAVTVGAEGQGMVAGDIVNTASRIQSTAEPGSVYAGEATKRASEAAVAYDDVGAHELKGKADRARLWRALRVVANRGGGGRATGLEAPFVGRDRELRLVQELFHGAGDDRRATLATVVGVAGIGKSRLAWELEKHIDGLADVAWWHRGRCLAYGEGVAFWALAEMVRMRARIAEDEPEERAAEKLAATVEELVTDPGEREWVEPFLRHLLGLGERPQAERADLFSAWRLFFERMSDTAPVALVFEDLHWADTALLDFIEHLLEWSRARPIFVLALTRPELLDRRPDFGAHGRSATRLVLEPLPDEAVDDLLRGLVPGIPNDACAQIRERADGIPLYAVETVRMLLDRGTLARDGNTLRVVGPLGDIDVPETLHALIAARLDGLDAAERELIQHAAVLGKTFGIQGLAALGSGNEAALAPRLENLVRKELLAIDLDPRSPERGQYGFLQALVQRVAYETLARRERGRLHRAAAEFLESEAGIDRDEIAEVIAAHHRDALAADPDGPNADDSRRAACAWLERAAERAAALGAPEDGQRAYDDAAAIAVEPLERARLLELAGSLARYANRLDAAEERLRAAMNAFEAAGAGQEAAQAAAVLGQTLWMLDRVDEALDLLRPAFDALSEERRDTGVGRLAAEIARIEYFSGDADRAHRHIELALDIAEASDDMDFVSRSLNTKSLLLGAKRPHEREALLREALRVAEQHDLTDSMLRALNNLTVAALETDRLDDVAEYRRRGLAVAQARGLRSWYTMFAFGEVMQHVEDGRWDAALALGEETVLDADVHVGNAVAAMGYLAKLSFERGDDDAARMWLARLPSDLAQSGNQQNVASALFFTALEAFLAGRLADGIADLKGAGDLMVSLDVWATLPVAFEWAADGASLLGDPAAAAPLADLLATAPASAVGRGHRVHSGRIRGFRAGRQGDETGAADAFAEALAAARSLGQGPHVARVLADYGAWLVECGRGQEAEPLLDEAHEVFAEVGAQRWLKRIAATRPSAGVAV